MDLTDPFREVLQRLRLKFTEKGNRLELCCPFHDDRTPSSSVYKSTGKFYCFTCDLTLNAAQFQSRFTGEGEDRTTTSLEEKYGPLTRPFDKDRRLRITKELAKGNLRLMELKAQGICRVGFARASELLDRMISSYLNEALTEELLDNYLKMWYNTVLGDFSRGLNAEGHFNEGGASGVDPDGWLPEGFADLSRYGAERVRGSVGDEQATGSDRFCASDAEGSDFIELA